MLFDKSSGRKYTYYNFYTCMCKVAENFKLKTIGVCAYSSAIFKFIRLNFNRKFVQAVCDINI